MVLPFFSFHGCTPDLGAAMLGLNFLPAVLGIVKLD